MLETVLDHRVRLSAVDFVVVEEILLQLLVSDSFRLEVGEFPFGDLALPKPKQPPGDTLFFGFSRLSKSPSASRVFDPKNISPFVNATHDLKPPFEVFFENCLDSF